LGRIDYDILLIIKFLYDMIHECTSEFLMHIVIFCENLIFLNYLDGLDMSHYYELLWRFCENYEQILIGDCRGEYE